MEADVEPLPLADEPPSQEADCDAIDLPGLYEELRKQRQEEIDNTGRTDFKMQLVGGKSSHHRLGVTVEAFKGQVVKGGVAERFCRLYHLQMSLAQDSCNSFGWFLLNPSLHLVTSRLEPRVNIVFSSSVVVIE
jgi:hypothetical protein